MRRRNHLSGGARRHGIRISESVSQNHALNEIEMQNNDAQGNISTIAEDDVDMVNEQDSLKLVVIQFILKIAPLRKELHELTKSLNTRALKRYYSDNELSRYTDIISYVHQHKENQEALFNIQRAYNIMLGNRIQDMIIAKYSQNTINNFIKYHFATGLGWEDVLKYAVLSSIDTAIIKLLLNYGAVVSHDKFDHEELTSIKPEIKVLLQQRLPHYFHFELNDNEKACPWFKEVSQQNQEFNVLAQCLSSMWYQFASMTDRKIYCYSLNQFLSSDVLKMIGDNNPIGCQNLFIDLCNDKKKYQKYMLSYFTCHASQPILQLYVHEEEISTIRYKVSLRSHNHDFQKLIDIIGEREGRKAEFTLWHS